MSELTLPNGYKKNAAGHLVPVDKIEPIDLLRDDLVIRLANRAANVQNIMKNFKESALEDIDTFMKLAAEQYDVQYGGRKGNLTLSSFCGNYKVTIDVQDSIHFDERLHVAKQLVDECIHRWVEGSNENIRALVEHAFQTDKQGNINTSRVLSLLRLKIDDVKWFEAMKALKDSIQVASSKSYLRLYERVGDERKYEQISLDISGL